MKVIKTNVYRLEIERDCGCTASREYEDPRYLKGKGDGVTSLCEKHASKSEDAQEILREMILDNLGMQAELAGKQYAPLRQVGEGDNAGVVATGESVQAMGVAMPARRRDPLAVTKMQVDRPASRTASAGTGSLNVAGADDGIEFNEEIGAEAAENPSLTTHIEDALGGLEFLDQDDAKGQGVSQQILDRGV